MKKVGKVDEQVGALRNLLGTVGAIHDWQRKQLLAWSALVFDGKWQATVSPEEHTIVYGLSGSPKEPKKVAMLLTSIRWLLGEQWNIVLMLEKSGKLLLDSRLSVENVKGNQDSSNRKGRATSKR